MCVCVREEEESHLIHLILNIQRAFLFMEEFQGLHVAVSRCVVDSVGSTLRVSREKRYSRI